MKAFPGGFDGRLKADTIPELEAISDGFGRAEDLDCYPLYLAFFNTLRKAISREPDNGHRRIGKMRLSAPPSKCEPDLPGKLRADIMIAKGGGQADDALRNPLSDDREIMKLGDFRISQDIEAPS